MTTRSPRLPDTTEANARMAWTLAETGAFCTVEQLHAIREYRSSTVTPGGRLASQSPSGAVGGAS